MSKIDAVATAAAALDTQLKGKKFLGGDEPSADDVNKFFELLGKQNTNIFRWAKCVASYSDEEKKEWGSANTAKSAKGVQTFVAGATPAAAPGAAGGAAAAAPAPPKKPKEGVIAKSSILIEIHPGDGEDIDMEQLAADIKAVKKEGLTWGAHRTEPLVFGLKKLTIMITIVDDLVPSGEDIEDIINAFGEERVGHVSFPVWNKV